MKVELTTSKVVFNEVEHSYMLGDKFLSGITGILSKYLFPDKYAGIPKSILDAAAERGTLVHSQMQMWIEGMPFSEQDADVSSMQTLCEGTEFIASEFTVSDNEHFASQIDAISIDESGVISLWDWKTTSRLDREYLSWQLSIYAYLFEKQTGLECKRLVAGHIRSGARVVEVQRIDNSRVQALLDCAVRGDETFDDPCTAISECDSIIASLSDVEPVIVELEQKLKAMKEVEDKLKESLMKAMDEQGVKKIDTEYLTVSVKEPTTRVSLDSKALKADMPEVFEKYQKASEVKGSITIKIKNNECK